MHNTPLPKYQKEKKWSCNCIFNIEKKIQIGKQTSNRKACQRSMASIHMFQRKEKKKDLIKDINHHVM